MLERTDGRKLLTALPSLSAAAYLSRYAANPRWKLIQSLTAFIDT
jgi:hypothetical protein